MGREHMLAAPTERKGNVGGGTSRRLSRRSLGWRERSEEINP
jgi:hypothetical protein